MQKKKINGKKNNLSENFTEHDNINKTNTNKFTLPIV